MAWADNYRVGVNDLLSVQMTSWDQVNSVIIDMPGVSGSFPVDADGDITLALAGQVVAQGSTTAEIARAVEAAMTPYVGIGRTLKVGVSVEVYAPIYVTGQTETPGAYEYTPGLTILQAVSLSGGLAGVTPTEGEERNFLTARGTINVLQNELVFLTAQRDRIVIELGQATDFAQAETDVASTAQAAELAILQARNARYDYEITSRSSARVSLEEALQVLEEKLATNRSQLDAGLAELRRAEDLAEQGLVTPIRVFERATYINELESRLLDIERSILLARQELQGHERAEGQLLATREEENAMALQQVETSIAETEAQLTAQYDLLSASAGQVIGQGPNLDPLTAEVTYRVTRVRGDGGTFAGDPSTPLMPGDVVEVVYENPASSITPSN
ncbi:polysaccharide biosynthesis/export family protein [Octadecabacter sp. G9-8]|uniref:Polysaccharide biosynthesis/export family protein n=1 Tax=Octadecabacter dasysiphoniae TaxID=2909341 RepID=A0ABS9CT51_9RHOB|nr:polysaccharide biosynthesis/export family protein [Octadecabacter dasysiphoniae]MCF2870428.1 polysaccharide biosynthesis/export family protein [Octadecabacter dasysiphoniae]